MTIDQATTTADVDAIRMLFREYAHELQVSLCFQEFAAELTGLPGQYAAPRGRLLLACAKGDSVGCVALRPISDTIGELKRLYVKPAFRSQGIGKRLAERIVAEARSIGFERIRLDTLAPMTAARRLYETLGFIPCPAYYETPLQDTIFMELKLTT
jgi:GNAT superfamily N-acetyltransferase